MNQNRRDFLKFMGQFAGSGAALYGAAPLLTALPWMNGCATGKKHSWKPAVVSPQKIEPLSASNADAFELSEGFSYSRLLTWGDRINLKGDRFGINCDFTSMIEESSTRAVLWVNHEYPSPMMQHRRDVTAENKTREEFEVERDSLGGTLVRLKRSDSHSLWELDIEDSLNRRLNARTVIPFAWKEPIAGATEAVGTMGNCAGGQTPWGTFLSCEENFQDYFPVPGEKSFTGWYRFWNPPVEHYGWVVEIDSHTGSARKLVALGRMRHEAATVVTTSDGRPVVYMGEDRTDSYLFKYVGSAPRDLIQGKLYAADLKKGRWMELSLEKQIVLKKRFATQTEVYIHAVEAAELLGATPLDRPEDIEINPHNGDILVACTNNKPAGRPHGSILRVREANGKWDSLEMESSVFIPGGVDSGISCPDNLAFDRKGGLWVTSDMAGFSMHKPPYSEFGNNSLFYVPMAGDSAGLPLRIANAPVGAEFTGPWFQKDGKMLLLSVQHPGEDSPSFSDLKSHWPLGEREIPRSAVVQIHGPGLETLTGES